MGEGGGGRRNEAEILREVKIERAIGAGKVRTRDGNRD